MSRKQSGFAKRIRREFDIEMQLYVNNRMQMAEDAAFMAANDILGLGAGRAKAFGERFVMYVNEIAELFVEDSVGEDEAKQKEREVEREVWKWLNT